MSSIAGKMISESRCPESRNDVGVKVDVMLGTKWVGVGKSIEREAHDFLYDII